MANAQPAQEAFQNVAGVPQRPRALRILCLDGGGVKSLTSLLILKRIFRQLGEHWPGIREPKPCDVFDLIVGTSSSGLIATMLGRLDMSIDECIEQYEIICKAVFSKSQIGGRVVGRVVMGMLKRPFFDIGTLQAQVRTLIERRRSPVDSPFCHENGGSCKVMLCVTRVASSQPAVLRSFRTTAPSEENYDCSIWEAASATAAAPIFFAPVKFAQRGEEWYGGGLRRNNPINETMNELAREPTLQGREVGCLISIGTGVAKLFKVPSNLAAFLRHSVRIMTDAEDTANIFASSQIGQTLAISNRYFRFNVLQGMQEVEPDDWRKMEHMRAMTDAYLRTVDCAHAVDRCAVSLLDPDANGQPKGNWNGYHNSRT